jgi:hypothetical protein
MTPGFRSGAVLLALGLPLAALASDRPLTSTYLSDTLPPGSFELEPWVTVRAGQERFFLATDVRLELEYGLLDGLQLAAYLNGGLEVADPGDGTRPAAFHFGGVSLEAKWKLLDASADALGLALYLEPTFAPDAVELEARVIVDKRLGDLVLAANVAGEYEFEFVAGALQREFKLELDLGASYQVTRWLAVGLELKNDNVSPVGEGWRYSAVFGGPVVSARWDGGWAALSVLPQLFTLTGPSPDLVEHQRLEARFLLGVHL